MSQRDPITEILMRPFAEEELDSRKIGGGRSATYVAGENVIRRLIEATGNQFDVSVKKVERLPWPDRTDQKTGELVPQELWVSYVELTIPGLGTREHMGVQVIDIKAGAEDVIKGVITDAVKKAATLFGVGLELYDKDPGTNRGGSQSSGGNDLAHWRKRVDQVVASNAGDQWTALFKDAGKEVYRWAEIILQVKSIKQLERIAQVAADHDMYTPVIEDKLVSRKRQLEKQVAPAGK